MVKAFQSLSKEWALRREMGQFVIVSAQDYTPKPSDPDYVAKSDVPWLTRYAKDGGQIVITGDCGMIEKPHELMALQQNGFVVVLFERAWSNWDFFKKSSLLLHYWITLAHRVKKSAKGALWRMPSVWKDDEELKRIVVKQNKLSKKGSSVSLRNVKKRSTVKSTSKSSASSNKSTPKKKLAKVDHRQERFDWDAATSNESGPSKK